MDPVTLALTTEQIDDIARRVASVVLANFSGSEHYREEVESWVFSELAGTPYLRQGQT